ncbi:hypothetical protein [Streptomyces sp. AM 2-1-1]|uniref:hypothetical protein n=1 Tax=Streptomyces sp. AM 2-1-1 TaxID=3028709 RepID=UPI0023BA286D|nr:hypothetical protein [Streptomyces sp. AM 2-1-1]WEH40756.1 hypothetical protein PZB77_15290 [Streptomyces sp. AM 2-1-1]
MSAYTRIYRNLTANGMSADNAAAELADLRRELGQELAAGLLAYAAEQYGTRQANDSNAIARARTRRFGAVRAASEWLITATSTGRRTTTPQQRTRSNP